MEKKEGQPKEKKKANIQNPYYNDTSQIFFSQSPYTNPLTCNIIITKITWKELKIAIKDHNRIQKPEKVI